MNPSGKEAGFASAPLMALLFFLSVLGTGTWLLVSAWTGTALREAEAGRERSGIEDIARELLYALGADPSPDTNSSGDPVWAWNRKDTGAFRVSVFPLSDRLNLNFVRKNILDGTRLSLLFAPGKNAAGLQQFREDSGLSMLMEDYLPFFAGPETGAFFSCYGWANINLIDEFAARKLALALTGSESAAERMRENVQNLLRERKICRPEELRALPGMDFQELYPWFNAEPAININFAAPALLRELLSYPEHEIDHVSSRLADIAARREGNGIAAEEIPEILSLSRGKDHILCQYLGSVTWFWEFSIRGRHSEMNMKVCRLPGSGPGGKAAYRIIEMRYRQ